MSENSADRRTKPDSNARQIQRRYSPDEVEVGLAALVMASGNTRRAAETLAELEGLDVPHTTLFDWKTRTHRDRYERIKEVTYPKLVERMSERMEGLFSKQADLEEQMTDRLTAELDKLSPRDLAGSLRNVGVSKALNVDKSGVLRGRPTAVVVASTDRYSSALAKLQQAGIIEVEAEAVEVEA